MGCIDRVSPKHDASRVERHCETRRRIRHQNNSMRGTRNIEEKNVNKKRNILKQGLTIDGT